MYYVDFVSLGQNIRKYRKEKNLSQEGLAELCHLSSGYIGDIERADRIPSLQSVHSISCALKVSLLDLLYESIPDELLAVFLDTPFTLRAPDRMLRNTLTNWYFADLPDESMIGEPPVTHEQLSRLQFVPLWAEMPSPFTMDFPEK